VACEVSDCVAFEKFDEIKENQKAAGVGGFEEIHDALAKGKKDSRKTQHGYGQKAVWRENWNVCNGLGQV
jgi:hypothetical protein